MTELAVAVGLEGAELDAELASVHQQRASLAAYEAGLIERKATLGAAHPLPFLPGARTDVRASHPTIHRTGAGSSSDGTGDGAGDGGGQGDPALQAADDFLPDEVAVLLNMSVPSTRHHVDHALTLVRQLPAVWHALADQRIDETRAKVIVRALGYQATSHGGPVPDGIIDDIAALGVEWAARGCAPTTLRERLDTALISADPAAADRRRELRTRTADVTVQGTGDSLAELRASQLDAADATLVRAQLDAYARRIKADGDPRPIGAIRVAVLAALVARPWEKQDPAIAHLTIDADLADLLPDLTDLVAVPDDEPSDEAAGDGSEDGPSPAGGPDAGGPGDGGPGSEIPADPVPTDVRAVPGRADDEPGTASTTADETRCDRDRDTLLRTDGTGLPNGRSRAGHVGGLPVTPAAVRALLQRIDALGLTHPVGGTLTFTITGPAGRLLAVATPPTNSPPPTEPAADSAHHHRLPSTPPPPPSTATSAPATGIAGSPAAARSRSPATPTTSSPTTTSGQPSAGAPVSPTW